MVRQGGLAIKTTRYRTEIGRRSTEDSGWLRDERILSIEHVAQSPSRISFIVNDVSRTYPRGLCMRFNRYVSAS